MSNPATNPLPAKFIAANRVEINDVDVQDGTEGATGYYYQEFDRTPIQIGDETFKACACGCRNGVTNAKRNFQPGHDQRLMGILVKGARAGIGEVSWTDGGMLVSGTAWDYASRVLSETGIAKLEAYLATEPKRARRGTATPVEEAPVLSSAIRVKVGRWEYDARVIERDADGTPVEVEFTNGKDEPVKSRNFKIVG